MIIFQEFIRTPDLYHLSLLECLNVKNQGVTDGVLIWNMEYNDNSIYGNANKTALYKSSIQKVFGPQ